MALELVDISLFNGALANFTQSDFIKAGFPTGARGTVQRIAQDEQAHADIIRSAVLELGAIPVEACEYSFPYSDVKGFMGLSAIVEGVGTSAYIGSLGAFTDSALTTAAGGILGAETRHNALLRYLSQDSPDPGYTDTPLSAQAVTSLAAGFFVPGSCPNGSALALTPFPGLDLNAGLTDPSPGTTLSVAPAVAFSAAVIATPIYCGFTSGIGVEFSTWTNGSCTIPSANMTYGQTYLALTSSQSLSDSAVLAGIAHFNLVDSAATFLVLEVNTTSTTTTTSAAGVTKTSLPKKTSAGNAVIVSLFPVALSLALGVLFA